MLRASRRADDTTIRRIASGTGLPVGIVAKIAEFMHLDFTTSGK